MPAFDTNQINLMAGGQFYMVDLIEIDFPAGILGILGISTSLYLCNAFGDLDLTTDTGAHTFIGGKNGLLDTPSVVATAQQDKQTIDVTLSALNLLYVATIQEGRFMNTPIRLYKQPYDGDSIANGELQAVGSPVKVFQGYIKGASYQTGPGGNSCTFYCHHWLYDNQRTNHLRTNKDNWTHWSDKVLSGKVGPATPFVNMNKEDFQVRWGIN
tara:strand:- start:2533 stop:3171 length:639 start_codon:yes stop_codon:yes gene_type:complete